MRRLPVRCKGCEDSLSRQTPVLEVEQWRLSNTLQLTSRSQGERDL